MRSARTGRRIKRGVMADTQWRRYMVFQQEARGQAHKHNGTVHAPDAEMALLNGRDVFGRRPRAVSMWVVPADEIYSKTAEELTKENWRERGEVAEGEAVTYYVCAKTSHQGQCAHVGEVAARSGEEAMARAVTTFDEINALMWWVFPASAVRRSREEEASSMFEPALEKTYRKQSEYPTVTMMRQIRSKGKLDE